MDLIIKPTQACQFKCTFCSSTKIAAHNSIQLDHSYIFRFLERFPQTQTIIVNGGDPTVMKPEYYWKIIEWLDKHDYNTSIAITSHLWDFYKKPEKWKDLFNNDRVGVTTSFQYGGGRLKHDFTEFTEDDFWKVSDMMLEHCGYRPDFIAVIVDDNKDSHIKTVELAKRMSDGKIPKDTFENLSKDKTGVECKLNYAMASGKQERPFLKGDIYEKYVEIYERGLHHWEFNTKQMMRRISQGNTLCPLHRGCDEGIRAFNPDGTYYSCGAFGDDQDKAIDFEREMKGEFFTPLQDDIKLNSMKEECYTCPMFQICNGCKKTIKDYKEHNLVEQHCKKMKQNANKIMEINKVI